MKDISNCAMDLRSKDKVLLLFGEFEWTHLRCTSQSFMYLLVKSWNDVLVFVQRSFLPRLASGCLLAYLEVDVPSDRYLAEEETCTQAS